MKKIIVSLIVFLLGVISQVTSGVAFSEEVDISNKIQFPVEKYVLDNGMTVLLSEDHSSPVVSLQQWYRVGSNNEKPGMTGIAHFFEHLMFKGTSKYPPGEFDRIIQANGGSNNAFTTRDYTGYYVNIPSGKLDLLLDIESDRMVNLLFNPKAIQSEREVVKEERRLRTENSVAGSMNEAMFSSVFKVNNYRWPVIGYMKDLNETGIDKLKQFYKTYYSPNNSVLVIVGDFQTTRVKKWIEKDYGHLKSQDIPPLKPPVEPVQKAMRTVTLKKEVQSPSVAIGYQAVSAGTKEQYAMDLLAAILGSGASSRLYKELLYKKQEVLSIDASSFTPKYPGIFEISATLKPGVKISRVVNDIEKQVEKMRTHLVSDKELEKVKNQVLMSFVDSLKTIFGKAQALALNEILFHDYRDLFADLNKYQSVTREDIREIARKYLGPNQRSIVKVIKK